MSNKKKYDVSVIIPIYNTEKYIERCVRSLFEEYPSIQGNVEYIFVDDCSPDNSVAVLKKLIEEYQLDDETVRIIRHEKNKGLTSSRNTGVLSARGAYIMHCDSDDWVEKGWIVKMYDEVIAQNADIVMCDLNMIFLNRIERWSSVDWANDKIISLRNYIKSSWTCLVLMLIRRDLIILNNLYSAENISYCEDFHLGVRLCYYAKKIVHLNLPLYNYNRQNESSIVHTLNEKTMNDEQWVYLDIVHFFEQKGEYENYRRELCWRILKSKQEWVLHTHTHDRFIALHPDSHHFILSCPYINVKQKIMMWCLTHKMPFITKCIIRLRTLLKR